MGIKDKLYASSPFDLASELDDAYRDGVDAYHEEIKKENDMTEPDTNARYSIGDEVVVYERGRIGAMEEESVWDTESKSMVTRVRYTIHYPDNQGFARVTEKVIERAKINN